MSVDMQSKVIWIDGALVPYADATVHFLTPTLHYGLGVFAGLRCYQTQRGLAVMRLEAHLNRFLLSIRALGFVPEYDVTTLREAVHSTIVANGLGECYVRALFYLEGPLSLDMLDMRPVIGIAAWRWDNYWKSNSVTNGIRMMVSSYIRSATLSTMLPAKLGGQYVSAMLAKTFASQAGFDEAIMLTATGQVIDTTGGNLFIVRDGEVVTPFKATHFGGITREALLILAEDAGYKVVEEHLSREQLYVADEVFVCGTAAEVVFVRSVDGRPLGNESIGPVTADLQKRYFDTARGKGARSAEWLNYVGLSGPA